MAYVIKSKKSATVLPYLPCFATLKNDHKVSLDVYKEADETELHAILNEIVEDGDSYPQEDVSDIKDFRAYYLSHDVYVCHDVTSGDVLGGFYVKPNFPGRCSHICNAGFIVKKCARGIGVGSFMVGHYLQIARDLGYKASFFNLVFVTNETSVAMWRKFGFKEIGVVPKAGHLKGRGYTDAIQFYYDLETIEKKV